MRGGGDVLADEVGTDREFAVPAVDEDGEADGARPAEVVHAVEGGTHRASRHQDVVDEDDRLALDVGEVARLGLRLDPALREVVAVERDVERADRRPGALDRLDLVGDAACKDGPAALDADEDEAARALVRLHDLVRDPPHGAADAVRVQDRPGGVHGRTSVCRGASGGYKDASPGSEEATAPSGASMYGYGAAPDGVRICILRSFPASQDRT